MFSIWAGAGIYSILAQYVFYCMTQKQKMNVGGINNSHNLSPFSDSKMETPVHFSTVRLLPQPPILHGELISNEVKFT